MTAVVKLTKIGNSTGLVLPKAELDRLGVKAGDQMFVVRTPGGVRLTPYDPDFADAVEAARDYMREHRDAMAELAKG
ncbi:MAG: AbrB/MazE/SpoVT family DNA-binding domain-containing protein [Rhodospirillales bacterium CG15_BIG_FIL_POST_REV_8_21_14_020_66_15]|nr:MAG: AbrB/MazE/SpoVT family DNA-binding domain-containing protein [Rhodospirillales bacterium CG15_BIG_FIL_POST_REV_8_21_14_020_66_15]